MKYRTLPYTDLEVSVIGIGNMSWPGSFWGETAPPGFAPDRAEIQTLVAAAFDAGVNLFDTAEAYGRGMGESLLGEALQALGRREGAVIVTKVGPLFGDEVRAGRTCNLSPAHIRARCEASLRRLRTDRIDLYLAHWPDPFTPIEDTVGAMLELVRVGKIRSFGVSNFDQRQLRAALARGGVAVNQLPYSLVDRRLDDGLRRFCAEAGVGIFAYSPLGKGLLSGKYTDANRPPAGDYRTEAPEFSAGNFARNLRVADCCRRLASRIGLTPAQLGLAWCLSRPGITAALPGPKSVAQLLECTQAADVTLDRAVLEELELAVWSSGQPVTAGPKNSSSNMRDRQ